MISQLLSKRKLYRKQRQNVTLEEKIKFPAKRTGHNFLYNLLHMSCKSEVRVQESVQYMVSCPYCRKCDISERISGKVMANHVHKVATPIV